ncbi:MAG: ABC transporter permease subunit [Idiomarina sp.]|nr:ABC transporter permease subunit [Idiomarina sp.]
MRNHDLYYEERHPSPLEQVWIDFKRNPLAMGALYILCFILFLSILGPLIAPYGSNQQFADSISLQPAWSEAGDLRFLLGTDELGRDMLSRLIHGARYTFGLPLLVVCLAAIVGMFIGAAAALTAGVKSSTLKHLLDVLLSIPSLLLALVIVAILGPGLMNALFAIGLALIPQFLHVTRNAVVDELKKDYVVASKLNGVSALYLMVRVVLPNSVKVLVVQLTIGLSAAILDIAALGFLRLGAQPPAPEWGSMLAQSLEVAYNSPWVMALPGLALFITLISVNIVGETLRSALQHRMGR